ncbi:helix-turn-helix domain-containing protein [Ancylobacter sp.]|uniref:helix-turn-helix domain-containing protein n=1 Tax=Ancylobacter sp. TaxID=1872567 RepID=UPI003D0BEA16
MTPEEFQNALAKLGHTPAGVAKLLGVDVRTARRWSTGVKPIPDSVAAQLATIVQAGGATAQMAAEIEASRNSEVIETSRFVWVQRKEDDPHWTVAEHDLVSDIFYLPGRVERFIVDELVIGPVVAPPPG